MQLGADDLTCLVLSADNLHLLQTFRCKNAELMGFLTENAYRSQVDRIASTRLVLYDGKLVGYFTLVTDVIKKEVLDGGDGDPDFEYLTYPALKIARLATHQDFERRGIGRSMLVKIYTVWIQFSYYIGCRIITVDAKPEAVGFYEKFAFHRAVINPKKLKKMDHVPLYIDIRKEIERLGVDHALTDFDDADTATSVPPSQSS